ncbi:MAG: glycosyltransferase family 4 protein [Elusimicrobiaceae bacterium]|nr:glycosyltransferase family 4 protein [Elusimicrobiaceae bacterium]
MPDHKKRIKVFHLITKLELGGAQANTIYTVRNLDHARFETHLLCGTGGMLDEEVRRSGIRVHFFRFLRREINPLGDLLCLISLWWFLLCKRPQILHTHSSKAGILGRIAGKLAGVPVIVHTFHGFGFNSTQPKRAEEFFQSLERRCARYADKLIFVSKTNMALAEQLQIGTKEQRRLIRSGIRLSGYPPKNVNETALREELGIPEDWPIVVSVGNLKPQKNPLDFVTVAYNVLNVCPEAVFLYLGDGPLRPEVEAAIAELKIADRCLFPGWRRDVGQILSFSSLFILTSLWEGLPRSLVQAVKSGLPCVAYMTDGVTDIIHHEKNGFLVRQNDTKMMSYTLIHLLKNDDLRAEIAFAANETDLSDFDIDFMVRQQEELYAHLLLSK